MASQLKVKQKRSVIGSSENQKRTVRALGLKRINDVAIHKDRPEIRGMINKVQHLVEIEEIKNKNPKH